MSIDVKVPGLPESVADASIATWHKKVGDFISRDENLVDLETDKVVLEVPAPVDGILTKILFNTGDIVHSGEILAHIDAQSMEKPNGNLGHTAEAKTSKPDENLASDTKLKPLAMPNAGTNNDGDDHKAGPSVRRLLSEHGLAAQDVPIDSKNSRLSKEQVLAFIDSNRKKQTQSSSASVAKINSTTDGLREERRVPMTRLRAKVAERLLQAQHNAAMLTTFNEVNLNAVMALRTQYKDSFEKKHGVKLGFMSFFTKAVVEALKRFPAINASIDGSDIVYHGYYDIGIAVSTERGLVVPVIRDANQMTMAEIEKSINDAANRARQGKLALEEMQGGTFTITNGGVFGSLLATPIINPPQTGILGMHKIQERPVVEQGQIVIRPMMYLALSYDHRLIDGKESVQFLVNVKELLEDPARLLLNI